LFDYRLNPWFVEAATSAKDIVIIADFSIALSDYKLSLVRATTLAALDTLGANDFVNVLSLESSNYEIVPCFKDMIVQVNIYLPHYYFKQWLIILNSRPMRRT